jgi:hypothetical protein
MLCFGERFLGSEKHATFSNFIFGVTYLGTGVRWPGPMFRTGGLTESIEQVR